MRKSRTYKIIVVEMAGPDSGAVAQTDLKIAPDEELVVLGLCKKEGAKFDFTSVAVRALDEGARFEHLFESKIDF